MSWDSWEKSAKRGPVSFSVKVFFVLLSIGLLFGGTCTVVNWVRKPFTQAGRIVDRTIDADNVIYNYEWFKLRYRGIEAIDDKIVRAKAGLDEMKEELGPRTNWKREDRTTVSRLTQIHLGLTQQRADLAAEYNAKAAMVNRQIFMGRDVPPEIPIGQ